MTAFLKTIALTVCALVLAAIALLVPAHIHSIDPTVLAEAGQRGASVNEKIAEAVNAAHIGPARRIALATQAVSTENSGLTAQARELITESPELRVSGGPDPYFETFLNLVQLDDSSQPLNTPVLPLLLPRSERAAMSNLLAESKNANVQALLSIRNLQGLERLHPAKHAAGAPYDAGVLTLGLLIEGGHFRPNIAQKIGTLASQANLRTPVAITAIEDTIIATLSLGRQLELRSLADLAQITESLEDWNRMATLFRAQPDRINALYTLLRFSESPEKLIDYISQHPEQSTADLDLALLNGPGSVDFLLEYQQALYRPAPLAKSFLDLTAHLRPAGFVELTTSDPKSALSLKAILLFFAGLSFATAMGAAWRATLQNRIPVSKSNPVVWARNVLASLVIVVAVWSAFEPDLLKSKNSETESAPRMEFTVASALESIQSPVKTMQDLNQVTLLVLALFFIIQLVIYCFCLIKLREVQKQSLSPAMKLRLLENEENLFDFGLYVGLGGTVLSLILVAIGIVEASLMAAYASTLFGILFTAVLKVFNLRGYRRRLILEAGFNDPSDKHLMRNLEL